jgi:hypothetical protein
MPDGKLCEYVFLASEGSCGLGAMWLVARGRSHDARLSCRRHLSATCVAMLSTDRNRHLTVTRIDQ